MAKSKQARSHEFTPKQREAIVQRDNAQCIFCAIEYHMEGATWLDLEVKSIMHYIPRKQGGLGIEQNGAVGCHWHHHMLDNGSSGRREEMLSIFRNYLQSNYKNWDEKQLTYSKWGFLEEVKQNGNAANI